jgi:hypothetical protein
MGDLSYEDFAGGVGRPFGVRAGEGTVDLKLDKAEPLSRAVREAGSFRLEFVGPVDPLLPQGTYPFDVAGAEHEIFIVPIARDASGCRYEAIFY